MGFVTFNDIRAAPLMTYNGIRSLRLLNDKK